MSDGNVQRQLDALRLTIADDDVTLFDRAVATFTDLSHFLEEVTLMTWGHFFPPPSEDSDEVTSRVFAILSGLVTVPRNTPECPKCGERTVFNRNRQVRFGWEYRCVAGVTSLSRAEVRKRKSKSRRLCTGAVQATHNTWFEKAKSTSVCLGLLFCWLNRVPVTAAAEAVKCGSRTAVDHYSMTREVCEVVMSHEILSRKLGGEGVEVEIDECYLTLYNRTSLEESLLQFLCVKNISGKVVGHSLA